MVIVIVLFHPHEPACFTVCFVVDVVVGVISHVVANAVLVTVLVAVLVTMVVVGVSASHFENGHCEIFRVFCVEFKDILAFFEMEDGNHGVSWAARWIGDGFLSLNVSVTFVSTIMVVMVVVAVFVMVVVAVFVMVVFIMIFFLSLIHI